MHNTFLILLSAALSGKTPELPSLSTEEQNELLRTAEIHRVLPLIYDRMHACGIYLPQNTPVHHQVRLLVSHQALRTLNFAQVYHMLLKRGIKPVVVKGILCRHLYPYPDFRISSDEDLLISHEEYPICCKLLTELGFVPINEKSADHYQHSFANSDGLHIELHTSLFDAQNPFFDKWNKEFEDYKHKALMFTAEGVEFLTLPPSEHLLYLVLHALKHFIHSGVGIRQVCDIIVFANRYEKEINWRYFVDSCTKLNALKFAMGIFAIGKKHLSLKDDVANALLQYAAFPKKEDSLLEDILSAGVYGNASLSRKHSSTITFIAAQGKPNGFSRQIFPPVKALGGKYSYAKKSSLLLPVAWVHRLVCYRKEINNTDKNSPLETVRIGKHRLKLLKEYGLINSK